MIDKRTLVLVASPKPERYAYKAVALLMDNGVDVIAFRRRPGKVRDLDFTTDLSSIQNIHTVTLYLNPQNQVPYYDYIASLNPQRVIFNPGTENKELQDLLDSHRIGWEEACTLVLLTTKQY